MFLQLPNFHGNQLIVIGGLLILVPHFLRVPVKLQATMAGPHRFLLIQGIFYRKWKQYFYEVVRNSWSYPLGIGSTWSLWKADQSVYSLLDWWIMSWIIHITELGFNTFWWLEASGFKALFLELFSDSFQLMIQHVFLEIAHGCKMVLMSTQVLLKEPSIQVEHHMPMQPVFLAYNRNRRVTEWRSHHKCFRFAAPTILMSKIRRNQMVLSWNPRGVMPAGEPWCPQGISSERFGSVEWKFKNMSCVVIFHFTQIYPFHWHCTICWFWKNQESEFAIGLRSLVFWGHFQIIMQWRYTPIQKRLLEHWVGKLMWEGHWRLTSLHRVSHHKLQKVPFEK